jgi:hypothetical protein
MDRRTFVAVMPALIMMGCAGSGTSPKDRRQVSTSGNREGAERSAPFAFL